MQRRAPAADDLPECLACGACCFSSEADYLQVFEVDAARLGADCAALTVSVGAARYVAMKDGHCAALSLELELGSTACTLYPRRPDVCRHLQRGSAQCRQAIARGRRPQREAPPG